MKLAFCLFNYFPYGGLQRDFIRIARACYQKGHEVHVYTMQWEGEKEQGLHLHLLKVPGLQNHVRCRVFVETLKKELRLTSYDQVIGFNKMPNLDWYYAADVCYAARIREERFFWHRLLPRYRQWAKLEKSVFAPYTKTNILLLSPKQGAEYQRYYQTEVNRFYHLPPGITKDRMLPTDAFDIRQSIREKYKILDHHFLLLMVGSGFKTKGLDRTLHGIAALPPELKKRCHLFVIGKDRKKRFIELAQQLHIHDIVHFLGGRDDVPSFLVAADLLLHPSYHENTGTVLLEALASGLPVLTVEACGYAHYIQKAQAGIVVSAPFQQSAWNQALQVMLSSETKRAACKQNGLAFAQSEDLYSLTEKAVGLIERSYVIS